MGNTARRLGLGRSRCLGQIDVHFRTDTGLGLYFLGNEIPAELLQQHYATAVGVHHGKYVGGTGTVLGILESDKAIGAHFCGRFLQFLRGDAPIVGGVDAGTAAIDHGEAIQRQDVKEEIDEKESELFFTNVVIRSRAGRGLLGRCQRFRSIKGQKIRRSVLSVKCRALVVPVLCLEVS